MRTNRFGINKGDGPPGHVREVHLGAPEAAPGRVRAVNHHGGFGIWAFMVCKEPNRLGEMLARYGQPAGT